MLAWNSASSSSLEGTAWLPSSLMLSSSEGGKDPLDVLLGVPGSEDKGAWESKDREVRECDIFGDNGPS